RGIVGRSREPAPDPDDGYGLGSRLLDGFQSRPHFAECRKRLLETILLVCGVRHHTSSRSKLIASSSASIACTTAVSESVSISLGTALSRPSAVVDGRSAAGPLTADASISRSR